MTAQFNMALFGSGQIDEDIAQEIILRLAEDSPILGAITARGAIKDTMSEDFSWFYDSLATRGTAINNAPDNYDENTTSIVVDDGTVFYANSLILFEATGEVGLVTAVSTNTLTVVRGLGSVVAAAAASVADNAVVRNIGSAEGEGKDAPTARMTGQTKVTNYVQLIRQTVELSGRATAVKLKTEEERAFQRRKKFETWQRDLEASLIWGAGQAAATDAGSKVVTTSKGLLQAVTTNVDNVAGTMTEARFYQFCQTAFAFGSSEKFFPCGSTVMQTLATVFKDRLRFNGQTGVLGLKVAEILTPYGVIKPVYHKSLTGTYAQYGIALDLDELMLRYLPGRRPQLKSDIQDPDADAVKDEWFGEPGLQWGDEQRHAVLKGVTGAA